MHLKEVFNHANKRAWYTTSLEQKLVSLSCMQQLLLRIIVIYSFAFKHCEWYGNDSDYISVKKVFI